MDTLLYKLSIPAISSLQIRLMEHANFMQLISVVFDPKYAFLIYSPIAFLCDQKVGKRLILTTVLAEWLNQVLKWLLHGERPYWYVHSSGHFDAQQVPIRQFPVTCELGPGHPSGHAMLTAAVWYIILSNSRGPRVRRAVWALYGVLLLAVSVSRVFLGCHFPHQCLAGAILGLILARWVSKLETKGSHFVMASLVLFCTAFATFGSLQALGLDPSWTIRLATKHCVKREYIHIDTAPFFSIMRYCGFALGCGLGLLFPLKEYANKQTAQPQSEAGDAEQILVADKELSHPLSSKNLTWFSIKILMALLMARLVDNLGLFVSHSDLPLFYSSAFVAYTVFSFAFVNL